MSESWKSVILSPWYAELAGIGTARLTKAYDRTSRTNFIANPNE